MRDLVVDWSAGPHHGLAWDGGVALIDGSVPHDVVRAVWLAMRAPGVDLTTFLAALDGSAPFAVVVDLADGTSHLAARGALSVTSWSDDGESFVSGVGLPGLQDRHVHGLRRVCLGSGTMTTTPSPTATSMRPLSSGVVPAGRLERIDPSLPAAPAAPSSELGAVTVPRAATMLPPPASPAPLGLSAAPTMVGAVASAQPTETLSGVLCPAGHANRPGRATCRVCADPLGTALQPVRPSSLGVARISNGVDVALSGPVVIGRDPRAARFQGIEVPQLVQVPMRHVSASHLELRLAGWDVLALDLGSTNGTYLRRGGEPPARLSDTVPLVLMTDDVLDLGHGVHVRFLEIP